MLDIDEHFVARQMRRQRAVIASGARGSRSAAAGRPGRGAILRRLMLGDGLLQILQTELQLIRASAARSGGRTDAA